MKIDPQLVLDVLEHWHNASRRPTNAGAFATAMGLLRQSVLEQQAAEKPKPKVKKATKKKAAATVVPGPMDQHIAPGRVESENDVSGAGEST